MHIKELHAIIQFIYSLSLLEIIERSTHGTLSTEKLSRHPARGKPDPRGRTATQPLFWGRAFISPKDIPFLTFFLLSLVLGFRMVDSFEPFSLDALTRRSKRSLLVLSVLWFATVTGLFAATPLIHTWIDSLGRAAAAGKTNILSWIASDIHKVEPEVYIQKYFVLYIHVRAVYFYLFTVVLVYQYRRVLPSALRFLASVLPAAMLLGITTCIRVLGPLAGLLRR